MAKSRRRNPSVNSQDETEQFPGQSSSLRVPQLAEGEVLAGRFCLGKRLGKGGMGAVYKAWDTTLEKSVALKFRLIYDQESDKENAFRRQRFLEEVQAAQQISHPNVCRIHEVWESDGLQFLSMEFIDGEDLERRLDRADPLSPQEALRIGIQICAGLQAIHSRGLFHQDLKPANVMLHPRDGAKISDFGLTHQDFQGITRLYASPEQLNDYKVQAQSDLYSLGLILYEMFIGELPTDSEGRAFIEPETIRLRRSPHLTKAIRSVISHCLEEDPSMRPKSAAEIERALSRAAENTDSFERSLGRWQYWGAPILLLILLFGSFQLTNRRGESRSGEEETFPGLDPGDVIPPWVRTFPLLDSEMDLDQDGSRLVGVPGGVYTLGSMDVDADSRPVHRVELSPFWITKVPITHAQFREFLEQNSGQQPPKYWKRVDLAEAWQPVVGASWDAARSYCSWAGMDLPTEAQWEAAARGLPERERYPYPWGSDPPDSTRAHFYSDPSLVPTRPETVGSFPQGAGPFNALDQLGNIWEWCRDGWNRRAYEGREGSRDPAEPFETAIEMVVRGGSYSDRAADLHVSYRASLERGRENEQTGFRCVYEPRQPASDGEGRAEH